MKTIVFTFTVVVLLLGLSVFVLFGDNIRALNAMTCGCPIGPPLAKVAHSVASPRQ